MFRRCLLGRFYVQKVLCSEDPIISSEGPFCSEGSCSEDSMCRRSHVQKSLYSEAPIFRMSCIKKKRNSTKNATRRGVRCGARNIARGAQDAA